MVIRYIKYCITAFWFNERLSLIEIEWFLNLYALQGCRNDELWSFFYSVDSITLYYTYLYCSSLEIDVLLRNENYKRQWNDIILRFLRRKAVGSFLRVHSMRLRHPTHRRFALLSDRLCVHYVRAPVQISALNICQV